MFTYNFPMVEKRITLLDQYIKITEESEEVKQEIEKVQTDFTPQETPEYDALAIETMDLIHACETLLRSLPLDDMKLNGLQRKVESKNRERGYYDHGGSETR